MDITFDCYGTLLDTRPVAQWFTSFGQQYQVDGATAWHQYCQWEDRLMYGTPVVPFTALVKRDMQFIDMVMGTGTLFTAQWPILLDVYQHLQPWPEVVTALTTLREAGHRVILMSNSTPALMTMHRQALGDQVDAVVLPEDTGCYKPDKRFFQFAAERLQEGPHVHVANGYWWDVWPCQELGWPCVWINRSGYQAQADIQPTATLPDLQNLPALITADFAN